MHLIVRVMCVSCHVHVHVRVVSCACGVRELAWSAIAECAPLANEDLPIWEVAPVGGLLEEVGRAELVCQSRTVSKGLWFSECGRLEE